MWFGRCVDANLTGDNIFFTSEMVKSDKDMTVNVSSESIVDMMMD
jgi:hypothetical protein